MNGIVGELLGLVPRLQQKHCALRHPVHVQALSNLSQLRTHDCPLPLLTA